MSAFALLSRAERKSRFMSIRLVRNPHCDVILAAFLVSINELPAMSAFGPLRTSGRLTLPFHGCAIFLFYFRRRGVTVLIPRPVSCFAARTVLIYAGAAAERHASPPGGTMRTIIILSFATLAAVGTVSPSTAETGYSSSARSD